MLNLLGGRGCCCDRILRRDFIQVGSLAAVGLALPDLLRLRSAAAAAPADRGRSVILLFAGGGPSQLETFDLKPEAPMEFRGAATRMPTSLPGLMMSDRLPRLAGVLRHVAVLRAVSHPNSEHERAAHYMMTGHLPSMFNPPTNVNPHFGSVISRELGPRRGLPPYVVVPGRATIVNRFNGPAFLGAAHGPFLMPGEPTDPAFGARDVSLPPGVPPVRLSRRLSLAAEIERTVRRVQHDPADPVRAMDEFYQQAFQMVTSPAARLAFDMSKEPVSVRDRYGRTFTGQGALLARRLVEAGVRFVTIHRNGWDTHANEGPLLRDSQLPEFDQAYSALINDLHGRGLLKSTLVVWMGEFGRTPRYNKQAGRDHWPAAGVALMAGGGVRGGQVIGATDERAAYPVERPVSPEEIAASIYQVVGVDYHKEYSTPLGRPARVLDIGTPIHELFS